MTTVALRTGDRVVLCTDGLTRDLGDADLANGAGQGQPGEAAACLARAARARGGRDDITVVVAAVRPMA